MSDDPLSRFEALNDFEQFAEARRLDVNQLLWQIPGLSLTAQSFLVAAAVDPDVPSGLSVGIALLGLLVALATMQLLMRHRYRGKLFSNALDASRERRGLDPIDIPDMFERIADWRPGRTGDDFRKFRRSRRHPQHWLGFHVWLVALGGFAVLDVAVLATAATQR